MVAMIRLRDPHAWTPLQAVIVAILIGVVAGGALILSAAESPTVVDGNIEWTAESALRSVVQLLCLQYQWPTFYAGEVKNCILGVGAGLGLIAVGVALALRSPESERLAPDDIVFSTSPNSTQTHWPTRRGLHPVELSWIMALLLLLWSFASSRWSSASDLSLGASSWWAILFLWSWVLGATLHRRAVETALTVVVVVTLAASLLAIWYFYGRNPTIRAKFPIGNPNFLGSSLIPGIVISVANTFRFFAAPTSPPGSFEGASVGASGGMLRRFAPLILYASTLGFSLWALQLTGSRGAMVGLIAALLCLAYLIPRGARKSSIRITIGLVSLACLGVALWYFFAAGRWTSLTGRDETLRFRWYAWTYAWRMFVSRPFAGQGQGGFALMGDAHSAADVLTDPLVFEARVSHAHSEWLEILADLGIVGLAFWASVLILCAVGLGRVWNRSRTTESWSAIALAASLLGLVVTESTSNGLRSAAVPTFFFTMLGLAWAVGRDAIVDPIRTISLRRMKRRIAAPVAVLLGLAALVAVIEDFSAARNQFDVTSHIREGKFTEAVRKAELAQNRLNPQRAIEAVSRLAEAHMLVARELQTLAAQRESRATALEVADPRILALARVDRNLSDEHCRQGSAALKRLIQRSPGYLNHGWLGYWLNMIQSENAASRGETTKRDQFIRAGAADLIQEIKRQPFERNIALNLVRVSIADASVDELFKILARPLRHHRMENDYAALLQELMSLHRWTSEFPRVFNDASARLFRWLQDPFTVPGSGGENAGAMSAAWDSWSPEIMRLAAVVATIQGDDDGAVSAAALAVQAYRRAGRPAALGLGFAAALSELADYQFRQTPLEPQRAIASATSAIESTPGSEAGRELAAMARGQIVQYQLAAGQEELAKNALRALARASVTEELLNLEMASRYRVLIEGLLLGRRSGSLVPRPLDDLLPAMRAWAARSIQLDPTDPWMHLIAADLAWHLSDDGGAASHIRSALNQGLPLEEARRFLQVAREQRVGPSALDEVWNALTPNPPP